MKICIVYDSRRKNKATENIVRWIAENLSKIEVFKIVTGKPWEIDDFEQDLFIIGSPIYWERPLNSIIDFLLKNKEYLRGKWTALFIVCLANIFSNFGIKYAEKFYLKPLLKNCSGKIIGYHIFRGWIRNIDYSVKVDCERWINELIKLLNANI